MGKGTKSIFVACKGGEMSSLGKPVLPGYEAYRSVMSNETAVYLKDTPAASTEVSSRKSPPPSNVISTVVKKATLPSDLVPLPFDKNGLAIDDAADLEASSDPEDD